MEVCVASRTDRGVGEIKDEFVAAVASGQSSLRGFHEVPKFFVFGRVLRRIAI